ncbi:copper homeostasis protein CutC [Lactobacillus sp. YT155]|uniref:copper homeostasis protein CutC n=1 Tax=Lactobacillus sp. YT155 TaxID=3060955 RepID=UPI00265D7366|nr:copper homeostasis protein CutC [Lactobacillus sp. YT155]MDO1604933.1 copper homeostasis protein CutC [Lactobacillus sp. YT155]
MILKEACVADFEALKTAVDSGANRIELNSNLAEGGTTPAIGTAKMAVDYCHSKNVKVIAMIRPRGGNFVYSKNELDVMKEDINFLSSINVDGFALGVISENHELDFNSIDFLTKNIKNKELVFHMAFDEIDRKHHKKAMEQLNNLRFNRILSHGTPYSGNLDIDYLREMISMSNNTLEILPGGGINSHNVNQICNLIGSQQAHGTHIV